MASFINEELRRELVNKLLDVVLAYLAMQFTWFDPTLREKPDFTTFTTHDVFQLTRFTPSEIREVVHHLRVPGEHRTRSRHIFLCRLAWLIRRKTLAVLIGYPVPAISKVCITLRSGLVV